MPHAAGLRIGDDVRVTGGPFTDFTGPAVALDPDRGRVQLTVDILGDIHTIDIPRSDVVRVG
ncbi:transcription termination/antitermination protein NusG [Kitasatospora sp. NPDC018058]|uniref:transcription termination/antitermination protein NusG n=1 Tax=Kitasatospora sp. NPDC018058 TaxID=3364025 RepID=UPI0037C125F9